MRKGSGAQALPGREYIQRILEDSTAPMGLADILRAMGLPLHLKSALRRVLHDMALAGLLARLPAGRLKTITGLPDIARATVTRLRADGCAYAHLSVAPEVSLLLVSGLQDGTFLLPGDDVLVRVRPSLTPLARREGRPIRLLTPNRALIPVSLTALSTEQGVTMAQLSACDSRIDLTCKAPLPAHHPDAPEWCVGSMALAERCPAQQEGQPTLVIKEYLGRPEAPGMAATLSILTHALPVSFSKEAEQQAQQAADCVLASEIATRRDLRQFPLITIDDASAEDFDDALWAERTPEGFRVLVAIADVASHVPAGSVLDREARERGNSVYLPGSSLPMLPASLSAGACSLKPHEDRLCLYVDLVVSRSGTILSGTWGKGVMRSAARLTYTQVQTALSPADAAPATAQKMLPSHLPPDLLPTLAETARALQHAATARGESPQEEYGPEPYIISFDTFGQPKTFTPRPKLFAHTLVARCMIAANSFIAEHLHKNALPGLFRVHARSRATNKNIASTARYTPHAAAHQGLGLEYYAHFTSPIRRYADLATHRALLATFSETAQNPSRSEPLSESGSGGSETLHELAEHLYFTERRAASAVQMCQNRLAALFLTPCCGQQIQAYVARTTRLGLSLTLTNTGTPSFLFRDAFADDSGMYDDSHPVHTAMRPEAQLQAGDVLSVVLKATDPARGTLTLTTTPYAP